MLHTHLDTPTASAPSPQTLIQQTSGSVAKTLPTAKVDLGSLFEFSRREKILNVSQRIHLRFFLIVKIEHQPNLYFLATGSFCHDSLRFDTIRPSGEFPLAPTPNRLSSICSCVRRTPNSPRITICARVFKEARQTPPVARKWRLS